MFNGWDEWLFTVATYNHQRTHFDQHLAGPHLSNFSTSQLLDGNAALFRTWEKWKHQISWFFSTHRNPDNSSLHPYSNWPPNKCWVCLCLWCNHQILPDICTEIQQPPSNPSSSSTSNVNSWLVKMLTYSFHGNFFSVPVIILQWPPIQNINRAGVSVLSFGWHRVTYSMVWYGILGFNVPLDTV